MTARPKLPVRIRAIAPWGIAFALVGLAWYSAALYFSEKTVPFPLTVARTLTSDPGRHLSNTAATAVAAALGLATAAFAATALVLFARAYAPLRSTVMVSATLLKASPAIVFVPLLIRLMGTGLGPKLAVAAMISFFPMFMGGLDGIAGAPLAVRELASVYGASPWRRLVWIEAPYALAGIMTGLKSSAPLAVVGAIVGEYMIGGARGGLGAFIMSNSVTLSPVGVYAGAVLSTSLGLCFFALASAAARLVAWRYQLAR